MRRPHLSLLLIVVLFPALALASMRQAGPVWSAALTTITAAILLAALTGALTLRGRWRNCWIGCAIFGWGAVMLSCDLLPTSPIRLQILAANLVDLMPREWIYPNRGVGTEVIVVSKDSRGEKGKVKEVDGERYLVSWGGSSNHRWLGWKERKEIVGLDNRVNMEHSARLLIILISAALGFACGHRSSYFSGAPHSGSGGSGAMGSQG